MHCDARSCPRRVRGCGRDSADKRTQSIGAVRVPSPVPRRSRSALRRLVMKNVVEAVMVVMMMMVVVMMLSRRRQRRRRFRLRRLKSS